MAQRRNGPPLGFPQPPQQALDAPDPIRDERGKLPIWLTTKQAA
jgi:hypothetical protein